MYGVKLTWLSVNVVTGGTGGGVGVGVEFFVNVAVTFCVEFIVTLHALVPVHAPLQPANVLPDAAVAVRATLVPGV